MTPEVLHASKSPQAASSGPALTASECHWKQNQMFVRVVGPKLRRLHIAYSHLHDHLSPASMRKRHRDSWWLAWLPGRHTLRVDAAADVQASQAPATKRRLQFVSETAGSRAKVLACGIADVHRQ